MPRPKRSRGRRPPAAGPEFNLTKAWADSRHSPALVFQAWRALYKAYGAARQQFSDVDWISLIAVLNIIAMARANRRRVDISYMAEAMGWPRTTALRRLQRYAGSGYLTLTREGRHTYVDNTRNSRRAVLRMIDVLIDSLDHSFAPNSSKDQSETCTPVVQVQPHRRSLAATHPGRTPGAVS